jgi:hypothetical protein
MDLRSAVIGAGYWGPKLVRNFRSSPDRGLFAVCDLDPRRGARIIEDPSTVEIKSDVRRTAHPPAHPRRGHRGRAVRRLRTHLRSSPSGGSTALHSPRGIRALMRLRCSVQLSWPSAPAAAGVPASADWEQPIRPAPGSTQGAPALERDVAAGKGRCV